ncbi:MAG TPA: hypothetical protein VIX37_07070, partial [Candidatus Sulfotelmatobacter sp.]
RQVLSYGFGLEVSRGGLYRALARMAHRAALTYDGLLETARQAPFNGMLTTASEGAIFAGPMRATPR